MSTINIVKVEGAKIADIYSSIQDALILANADRATAIAALLGVIATQLVGKLPDTPELIKFTEDASSWMSLYLMPQDVTQ